MTHLATWADPVVRWDSKLFDWLGNPVLTDETTDQLHRDSVAAHVGEDQLVAGVETPSLVARIDTPSHVVTIETPRLFSQV